MNETINGGHSDAGVANSAGTSGEESPSQLDHLVERLRQEIPTAVTSPIIYIGAALCLTSLSAGHEPSIPDFRRASVELQFAEFSELSEDDFKALLHEFEALVISAYSARSAPVPPDMLQRIDPASKSNIIRHEADHLRALPDQARDGARFVMSFTYPDYDGEIADDITGAAIFDTSLLEPRERLQVALAPEVLSPADIDTARHLLNEVSDPSLTTRVEADIADRGLIDFSSPM